MQFYLHMSFSKRKGAIHVFLIPLALYTSLLPLNHLLYSANIGCRNSCRKSFCNSLTSWQHVRTTHWGWFTKALFTPRQLSATWQAVLIFVKRPTSDGVWKSKLSWRAYQQLPGKVVQRFGPNVWCDVGTMVAYGSRRVPPHSQENTGIVCASEVYKS